MRHVVFHIPYAIWNVEYNLAKARIFDAHVLTSLIRPHKLLRLPPLKYSKLARFIRRNPCLAV